MLTQEDLQAISNIIDQRWDEKMSPLIDQKLDQKLKPIKKDLRKLEKKMDKVIDYFDGRDVQLNKRVTAIEKHFHLHEN